MAEKRPQQAPDLAHGQRQQVDGEVGRVRTPGSRLADGGKLGEREHDKRHVAMPTDPGAPFVVVQPYLALGLLEEALDGPARACDLQQIGERAHAELY